MKIHLNFAGYFATLILISVINYVISQGIQTVILGQSTNIDIKNEATLKVDLEWDNKLTPSEQPVIIIETSLQEQISSFDAVNFVVLYGQNSEYWKQTTEGRSKVTLCTDHTLLADFPTSLIITAQNAPNVSHTGINIMVRKQDIELKIGKAIEELVSENSPITFLVNHSSRNDSSFRDTFILTVDAATENDKDQCIVVSIYKRNRCPFRDKPENVFTADISSTALEKSTTTIKAKEFPEPFHVSVVMMPENCCREKGRCNIRREGFSLWHRSGFSQNQMQDKKVRIKVETAMAYTEYLLPIFVGLIPILICGIFGIVVICLKNYNVQKQHSEPLNLHSQTDAQFSEGINANVTTKEESEHNATHLISSPDKSVNGCNITIDNVCENIEDIDGTLPSEKELENIEEMPPNSMELMNVDGIDGTILDRNLKLWEEYKKIVEMKSSDVDKRLEEGKLKKKQYGLMRLKENPMLSDMTTILDADKWFRRNRSKVYLYLVPIITVFYFVPSIQYVLLTKQSEIMLGTQDICFHNFRCARPFWIFDDFNHIISNISYVCLGIFFIIIVKIKSKRLPLEHQPKYDHLTTTGTLQQLSIFYAMGISLIAQGCFSVCYHVCPTNLSLQFDTTMMYVMSVLCFVKIYQFRHPNAIQNAYSTFMILGILVFLEALVLFSSAIWVYLLFIAFYIGLTTFLAFDLYYHGVGRIDLDVGKLLAKDVVRAGVKSISSIYHKEGNRNEKFIRYPQRFWFSSIFFLVNLVYAIHVMYLKSQDSTKTVSHVLLVILCGNMMLYLLYYVVRKNTSNIFCCGKAKTSEKEEDNQAARNIANRFQNKSLNFPAGAVCATISLIIGVIAIGFYQERAANRNLAPAESRNLNSDCSLLNFYGKNQ